jgi:hypothetical protein
MYNGALNMACKYEDLSEVDETKICVRIIASRRFLHTLYGIQAILIYIS